MSKSLQRELLISFAMFQVLLQATMQVRILKVKIWMHMNMKKCYCMMLLKTLSRSCHLWQYLKTTKMDEQPWQMLPFLDNHHPKHLQTSCDWYTICWFCVQSTVTAYILVPHWYKQFGMFGNRDALSEQAGNSLLGARSEVYSVLRMSKKTFLEHYIDLCNSIELLAVIAAMLNMFGKNQNAAMQAFTVTLLWLKFLSFLTAVNLHLATFIMSVADIVKDNKWWIHRKQKSGSSCLLDWLLHQCYSPCLHSNCLTGS